MTLGALQLLDWAVLGMFIAAMILVATQIPAVDRWLGRFDHE